jgi:hypothetical protein
LLEKNLTLKGAIMAIPLDPKGVVTTQELVISNMLEGGALGQLIFEKGIMAKGKVNEQKEYKKNSKGSY